MSWNRTSMERDNTGDYFFSGKFLITRGIQASLNQIEIMCLFMDLHHAVQQYKGLDYLQVYENTDGRIVWFIDNLSQEMLDGDGYTPQQKNEYNYYTLMLPEEY